jgi:hypothetical protein
MTDDAGGVSASGEWLGVGVGREWTDEDQAWADKQAEEHTAWFREEEAAKAAAAAWVRKMQRKHRRCTNCTDGVDGEPDGMGGFVGGTCQACGGSGWVLKTPNAGLTAPGTALQEQR